jgi:uncharacterized protein YcnI
MYAIARTVTLAAATTVLAAGTASAHIQAFPVTNGEGNQALVTFAIPHGCEDAATTKLEVNFPKEVLSVTAVSDSTWAGSGGTAHGHSAAKEGDEDHSALAEGEEHSDSEDGTTTADSGDADTMAMEDDGSHTATWTAATPVPSDELSTPQAVVVLPTDMAGETLWLPTIQTCEGGATEEWTTKEAGADSPAPNLVLASEKTVVADEASDDAADSSDDESTETAVIAALVLGGLGTLLGLIAVLRGRGTRD